MISSNLPGYLKFLASTRATIIARSGTERKHVRTAKNLGEAQLQASVTRYPVLDDPKGKPKCNVLTPLDEREVV